MELSGYPYVGLIVTFIVGFFAVRMGVGIWASRKVSNAADYIVAGRRLPIYMVGASVMATWFAAETLMGASSTGYQYGFQGVIFDPFGAAACLFISGFFFTRMMRRARYLTVVDFFDSRYGEMDDRVGLHCPVDDLLRVDGRADGGGWHDRQCALPQCADRSWHDSRGGLGFRLHHARRYAGRYPARLHPDVLHCWRHGSDFWLLLYQVGGWEGLTSISSTLYNPKPFTLLPDMAGRGWLSGLLRLNGLDVLDRGLACDRSRFSADPGLVPAFDVCP